MSDLYSDLICANCGKNEESHCHEHGCCPDNSGRIFKVTAPAREPEAASNTFLRLPTCPHGLWDASQCLQCLRARVAQLEQEREEKDSAYQRASSAFIRAASERDALREALTFAYEILKDQLTDSIRTAAANSANRACQWSSAFLLKGRRRESEKA